VEIWPLVLSYDLIRYRENSMNKKTILIVDDSEFDRSFLIKALEKNGNFKIIEASCGKECWDILNSSSVDLILLDIMMPEESGISIVSKIRQKYNLLELPIIMVTSKTDVADIINGLHVGANDYITKPIIVDILLTRILLQLKYIEISKELRVVFNAVPVGIFEINKEYEIIEANRAASEMLGYTHEEFLNKKIIDVTHPDDLEETSKFYDLLTSANNKINKFEKRYIQKDGTVIWCRFSSQIQDTIDSQIISFEDITLIKSLEEQSLEHKKLIDTHMAALNASSIVSITDTSGKITFVNSKFCQVSHFLENELVGNNYSILKSKYHSKEFFKDLWTTISSGKIWNGEMCNQAKNGNVFWINSTIIPFLDSNNLIESYVSIAHDITTSKNNEAGLIQSAKMATLGEMAGGIAHEINNPLGIIRGKSLQLLRKVENGIIDPANFKIELHKIEETSMKIAKIVQGLRTFSRNGTEDPNDDIQISKIIEDTLELCAERFKDHSIDLSIYCPSDLKISCRASQISQVLMNLLSNAHDAIENFDEKWIKLEVKNEDPFVKIIITDSGIGIKAEVVEKMLHPFFSTKEVGKGTGLGLSISKGIIENHKGSLRYDSTSKNTCFIVELPIREVPDKNK
jgi:PAS domain S-box-containing protein